MRDIKNYVCSLEQGDKLHSLLSLPKFRSANKKINTFFVWANDLIPRNRPIMEEWNVVSSLDLQAAFIPLNSMLIPAFNSQELGELIVKFLIKNGDIIFSKYNMLSRYGIEINKESPNIFIQKYDALDKAFNFKRETYNRAEFLIHLLENIVKEQL